MTDRIGFGRTVPFAFNQAIERVTEELKKEGFGVLTQIDIAATLKSKLGVEFPAYRILGACNPQLAHRALQIDPQVGLLLPATSSCVTTRAACAWSSWIRTQCSS